MAGSLGNVPRLILLTSGIVSRFQVSPFLPGTNVIVSPCATGIVYSVPVVGTNDSTRYMAIQPDGATTTFTAPAGLNAFPATVDASITDANRLQTIVLVNGSPLVRRGSDIASPAAGQFSTPTTTTVKLGSTYAAGVAGHVPTIEVLSFLAGDISATASLSIAAGPIELALPGYATASAVMAVEPESHH